MREPADRQILLGFVEETRSYLPRIAAAADAPDGGGPGTEEAHRLLHSVRGAAAMLGLAPLAHVALLPEGLLEEIREGNLLFDADARRLLQLSVDVIGAYLQGLLDGRVDERVLLLRVLLPFRRYWNLPASEDAAEVDRVLDLPPAAFATREPPPQHRVRPAAEDEGTDRELLETFLEEAEDHLRQLWAGLDALGDGEGSPAALAELRRSVHTLKGSAGVVGLGALSRVAHRFEDLLQLLHEERLTLSEGVLDLLQESAQVLEDLTEARMDTDPLLPRIDELFALYESVMERETVAPADEAPWEDRGEEAPFRDEADDGFFDFAADDAPTADAPAADAPTPVATDGSGDVDGPTAAAPAAATPVAPASRKPRAEAGTKDTDPGRTLRIPIERVDELVRLVGELSVNRSVFQQVGTQLDQQVEELGLSSQRVRRIAVQFETERDFRAPSVAVPGAAPWSPGPADAGHQEFDPLELESYSELDRTSRQLNEATSDISALRSQLHRTADRFDHTLDGLGRLTAEVQDRLLKLRMVPVGRLASRLRRTVRRTAAEKAKRVELVLAGGDIELDTSLLDELTEPLFHLLRNAVDHGIEAPEQRLHVGKPEAGRIHLTASQSGPDVVLEIGDDGAGLDPEALRRRAVEGGFLGADGAAAASTAELQALIFQPGFSTARQVSEISGRGVGLDVVRAVVARMKGSVTVSSVPGAGTTFTLRLPVTLALARIALVQAGGETLAVPFAGIRQILRSEEQTFDHVGDRPVVLLDGGTLPCIELAELLAIRGAQGGPSPPLLLVVDVGDRSVALAVDRLLEAREVVVRSVGAHLHGLPGMSGATILGDGSVVLILNLAELLAGTAAEGGSAAQPATTAEGIREEVLIVDDSLTVRRALARIVAEAGWQPLLARDGLEALEVLQGDRHRPRALLLDIEMPRMDGYQLTATLRAQHRHRQLPIVIITSRASDRHRRKAFELGADRYLVKPLQEGQLVTCLHGLLRGDDDHTRPSLPRAEVGGGIVTTPAYTATPEVRFIRCTAAGWTVCLPLAEVAVLRSGEHFVPNDGADGPGGGPMGWIDVAGDRVPAQRLADLLGVPGGSAPAPVFVLLGPERGRRALAVEEISRPFAAPRIALPRIEGRPLSPWVAGAAWDGSRFLPVLRIPATDIETPEPVADDDPWDGNDAQPPTPPAFSGNGAGSAGIQLLVVSAGGEDGGWQIGLPPAQVSEVRRSEAAPWALPGAPRHVLGLIAHDRRPLPVVDLGRRLGLSPGGDPRPRRLLLVRTGGGRPLAALAANADPSLRRLPADPPPAGRPRGLRTPLVRALFEVEGRTLVIPDLERLVQPPPGEDRTPLPSHWATARKGTAP